MECKEEQLLLNAPDWQWTPALTDIENIPADKTAVYAADGQSLTVGPWIASTRDVRLTYQYSLPLQAGTICGKFRTEELYPREGNLWITYKQGERTMTELNFWFGSMEEWTDFCFPVFAPLEGCDKIVLSFGFHMKTHGRLHLTGLHFGAPHQLPVPEQPEPAMTRSQPPAPGAPGEFPRLEKTGDGTWWLVDTNGKPFFSTGCAMYNNRITPEETYPTLEKLHINTVANGSDLAAWSRFNDQQRSNGLEPVFQFYRVNTDISARSPYDGLMNAEESRSHEDPALKDEAVGGFNHAFPDPFDPRWEEDVRKQIQNVTDIFHDKPYFIMWMAANERSHWNLYRHVWSPYCAAEFEKYLRGKYASISELNAAWHSSFASFEDLMEQKPEPHVIEGCKYEDFNAFSRVVLRTFNKKIVQFIREADPGRLIFSNRFMIHEVRGVFDNLDLYDDFDGIAVNIYPSNDVWGLDLAERQYFQLIHEKTGKPLIVCEWSVPARDSGLYDNPAMLDWSYPQLMNTQQERAQQIKQVAADFYNMPFMVGAHWFSWGDFKHATRQSNRGIFRNDGLTPYPEAQDALEKSNRQMN